MVKIGYRTIKTAIGATISISLAQLLDLSNFASAGILTILCIQVTKMKSIRSSTNRLIACIVGMIYSLILFEGVGYNPITIGVLLLVFIPTLVRLKATEGIATSAVIILHIFAAQNFKVDLIVNELALIIIGIGVALVINLYMPSVDKELKRYKRTIEKNFSKILYEMVIYLKTNESTWDGKEITETENLLQEAKTFAFRDVENHFKRLENHYYHYFKMREKQFDIIERMLPIVTSIPHTVDQGKMIAEFMEEVSQSVHSGNTAVFFLQKLYELRVSFQKMELPTTREEFEVRAALFQFLKEMEDYLIIKRSFKGLEEQ